MNRNPPVLFGENNPGAIFTDSEVDLIRRRVKAGTTQVKIAEEFDCDPSTISNIIHHKTYRTPDSPPQRRS